MNELDAAWLAGLFDGEGYINFADASETVALWLGMTHEPTIERVKELTGGCLHKRKAREGRKQAYVWRLSKRSDVLNTLMAIEPYVITKKESVRAVLSYIEWLGVGNVPRSDEKTDRYLQARRQSYL